MVTLRSLEATEESFLGKILRPQAQNAENESCQTLSNRLGKWQERGHSLMWPPLLIVRRGRPRSLDLAEVSLHRSLVFFMRRRLGTARGGLPGCLINRRAHPLQCVRSLLGR